MQDIDTDKFVQPSLRRLAPRWTALHAAGLPACEECTVRQVALFSALDGSDLLQAHAHVAPVRLSATQRLLTRGTQGQAVYTVRSGLLRVERFTEGGERRIVRLAGAGTLLGTEALVGAPHVDDVIACTRVELCRISLSLFPADGSHGLVLANSVLRQSQRDMNAMVHWAMHLTRGSARERLLHLMRLLSDHADAEGVIWLPRRDEIGDMLDITFETASRQVSGLRREGVLHVISQHRARVNREALEQALAALAT